jgi:nicotinamide mononucleotide adenylyltransferase
MSGAAGGSRIDRENLKQTIRNYRDNVLKPLGLDGSYNITGVRNRRDKYSYGDIDIVLAFKEGDRVELKQELAKHLSQIGDIPTMPHKKDKKYFIHGNIVTTLYPISGREGEYVQIDNIVSVGKEEGTFTHNMLDLPAEQQTLAISLVKAVFTELDDNQIQNLFGQLRITNPEQPGEGEEYDFNLNPTELSLRIVPIGKNDGREIWKSTNFADVKKIPAALGIDIENDTFNQILSKIKQFKERRSVERFKGLFNRNIRVGAAEKDTEKGNTKQQALDAVAALQESDQQKVVAIFPGKFKPPHRDHIARILAAAQDADEVIVLVSPKTEPGGNVKTKKDQQRLQDRLQGEQPVTADQSLEIFKLAKLPTNVTVMRSDDSKLPVPAASPVTAAYEIFKANPEQQYIAVFGKEEDFSRYGTVSPNVTIKNYDSAAGNISATDVRKALKAKQDISQYLPDGMDNEKYKEIILGKSIEQKMADSIDEVFNSFFPKKQIKEGSSGTPIAASGAIPSADRAELVKLYDDLIHYIPNKTFRVEFQQDRIMIYNKVENPVSFDYTPFQGKLTEEQGDSFDYTPYIASILEYMMDQGMKITPLPEIKIKRDPQESDNFFGKTAYYNPNDKEVVLYVLGRHPKDICRSFTHEMIHHMQNLEGRLGNIQTTNTNEDSHLQEIEDEAVLRGGSTFRNWEDRQKKNG